MKFPISNLLVSIKTYYYIESSYLPNVPSVIFLGNLQHAMNLGISPSSFLRPKRHNANIILVFHKK